MAEIQWESEPLANRAVVTNGDSTDVIRSFWQMNEVYAPTLIYSTHVNSKPSVFQSVFCVEPVQCDP